MLTKRELAQFNTFGYVMLRATLTDAEVRQIQDESLHRLEASYAHAPFDGSRRYWVSMNGPTTPFTASLIEDPRFRGIAEQVFGEFAVGGRCDASRSSQDTTWHPDTISPQLEGLQFGLYLQPVGGESGALRVIPGSHRQPLFDNVDRYLGTHRPEIADVPSVVLVSRPGDVVCYDIRLWHAVAGGFPDRRFCNLTYYHLPPQPEAEAIARAQDLLNRRFVREMARPEIEAAARTGAAYTFRPHLALFDPHWVANPDNSPVRARWIQRLRALGFLDDVTLPIEPIELPHV